MALIIVVVGSMMVVGLIIVVGLIMAVVGIWTGGWYALSLRVGKQQKMNAMFYSCSFR